MQPLEEQPDPEVELAPVLEMKPAEERTAPLRRRVLLHGALAVAATPLPGGLLLAARLLAARRGLHAAAMAAAALAVTGLGFAVALLAPVPAWAAAGMVLLPWLATGLAAAVFESRAGLAPLVPWASDPRTGLQALTWGGAFLVGAISIAFVLATVSTRWGEEIFAKPTAYRQVLLMGLLALVPAGLLTGAARGLLRRPHRLAPPVLFSAALHLLVLSAAGAQILWTWLARGLSRTEEIEVSSSLPAALPVFWGLAFGALWLVLALYLAESRRTRDFVQRWLTATALIFLAAWSFDVTASDGPVSWRNRWAETAAAEGRHADAARHWDRATGRAPLADPTAAMARKGAREALLAGDPALARRLLLRISPELVRERSLAEEEATARDLLASRLDLGGMGGTRSVRVAPVAREDYLGPSWSALLTAVRSVRPGLDETEVKQRLQDLSDSPAATNLPGLTPLLELRVVADLFDLRAAAVPWRDKERLLAAGIPVLLRLPDSGRWLLLFWSAPGADAVLVLDYALWNGEEKEDLEREEVARMLVGGEGPEARTARNLARVAALHSGSRLARLVERDGGLAFALVERGRPSPFPEPPPELLALELARRELDRSAFARGLALAAQVPAGAARDELLASAWLSGTGRDALAPGDRPAAQGAAARLTAGPLAAASPWFVGRLETLTGSGDPAFCGLRERVLREAAALEPGLAWRLRELAQTAADAGRGEEAADMALRSAAAQDWDGPAILQSLEVLAAMPGAGESPAVRAALERLLERLDPVLSENTNLYSRSSRPAWWAGRAALARDAGDAVDLWRRGVELEPKSAAWRKRLAEALERAGRREEAAEARRWAAALESVPSCPGRRS